jgi:nucleoside-diphosphate-sugar epimerase
MIFTVLGAGGFIGTRLRAQLSALGHDVRCPSRADLTGLEGELGHVIYAIGLTADFRARWRDTIDAHVCLVNELLRRIRFQSFLYLSSTRVYRGAPSTQEDQALSVNPADLSDLYNLSKLTGEAICLNHPAPGARVARLSNVYGPDFNSQNFVSSLIRDALSARRISLESSLGSAKDYIFVDRAVARLIDISLRGRQNLYNVASGINTTNNDVAAAIARATGAKIEIEPAAPEIGFPPIDIGRLSGEFPHQPSSLVADLPNLINEFRRALHS